MRFEIESLERFPELAYEQGWTDGLPVLPPTREIVQRMIDYVGRDPGEVIGAVFPGDGEATIENVAANCAMAGCLPEYVPVVIAAVRCIVDPGLIITTTQSTGSGSLLTIVSGACAFTAVVAAWKLTRGTPDIRLMALISFLVLTPPAWAVRPQVLSLALLMLAMWLVLRDKIAWLPALIVVWANAHGVVLLGVVIACVNVLDALIWSRRRFARALVVAGLCVAAPMATPLGWHYWPRVAQTVSEARLLGFQEYRSAFADASGLPFWLMFGLLVSSAIVRIRSLADWDRSERLLVLTALVLGAASIVSIRNAPFFALLAAPAISRLIHLPHRHRRQALARSGYAITAIAIVIAYVVVGFSWRDGGAHLGWRPIPPAAISAIRNCSGPIYNELPIGGTLIWFVPAAAAGLWIGNRLHVSMSNAALLRVLYFVLLACGLSLVLRALFSDP